MQKNNKRLVINEKLVHRLVEKQFPKWKDLPILEMFPSGWDNRTFRLGEHMLVRLPSAIEYAPQVEKEHKWLPKLSALLPLQIPEPLEFGEPSDGYPWNWSIYSWLEGDTAADIHIKDLGNFASRLTKFIKALERIDPTGGPLPGAHNFFRGGKLVTYDKQTRQAIAALEGKIDCDIAREVWESALMSYWKDSPVWVHGDISAGNLLVKEGALSAVLDFGMLAVGDPACDLVIAWTLFKGESRKIFCEGLSFDVGTWDRARGWTLWKALIIVASLPGTNTAEVERSWQIINEVLSDYKRKK